MRYAFDDFELDSEAYELLRGGKRVKVQPKVLQLIRYLVQNHGRFVSKEEILAALWPNEHVTESSLFVCVRAARIALGRANAQNRQSPRCGRRLSLRGRVSASLRQRRRRRRP